MTIKPYALDRGKIHSLMRNAFLHAYSDEAVNFFSRTLPTKAKSFGIVTPIPDILVASWAIDETCTCRNYLFHTVFNSSGKEIEDIEGHVELIREQIVYDAAKTLYSIDISGMLEIPNGYWLYKPIRLVNSNGTLQNPQHVLLVNVKRIGHLSLSKIVLPNGLIGWTSTTSLLRLGNNVNE